MSYEVIGLRIEKVLLDKCDGHNCDFNKYQLIDDQYVFLLKGEPPYNRKYELTLYIREGECGSGWSTASWCESKLKCVHKFSGITHLPIESGKTIDLGNFSYLYPHQKIELERDFSNEFFELIYCGDEYYPSGFLDVKMDNFRVINQARIKDKRPVWIFYGVSNLGKSYISSKIYDLEVYETDIDQELPDKIEASIIIIGNKYGHDIDCVKSHIFDLNNSEIILVNFGTLSEMDLLRDEIAKLKQENMHLRYMPGGANYQEVVEDFETLRRGD